MKIKVTVTDGPLDLSAATNSLKGDQGQRLPAGAVLSFEGIVRLIEDGRKLKALNYEVYEPMTSSELKKLAQEIADKYELLLLTIEHSRGEVPVGRCSLKVKIASSHRKEAIAALSECIDRIKHKIPIWKTPVWLEQ